MVRPRLRRLLTSGRRARPLSTASVSSEQELCMSQRTQAVLHLLTLSAYNDTKGTIPLSPKEVEYCNEACIARVLKAKGNQVKKAAKQLRATLAWRANLDVDYLTADEFSAELAMGSAYVAGHDEHGRPVLMVRLKPESLSNQSQKQFLRYMAFCMEVAIGCMPSAVEQCILILDSSCLKKGSPGMSVIIQLLKVIGEHYPERVATTFMVDAPIMFYFLWKGMGKFLDLKMREKLKFVFSRAYNTLAVTNVTNSSALAAANNLMRPGRTYSNRSLWEGDDQQSDVDEDQRKEDRGHACAHATSTPTSACAPPNSSMSEATKTQTMQSSTSSSKPTVTSLGSLLSSSSFSLAISSSASSSSTILSESSMSSSSSSSSFSSSSLMASSSSSLPSSMLSSLLLTSTHRPTCGGPALLSDKNQARSLSFASTLSFRKGNTTEFRSFRADTRSRRIREEGSSRRWTELTFGFNKKDELSSGHIDTPQKDKNYALFRPYYTAFFSKPYSEAAYRAQMKPPLAGLISILGPDIKLRQQSFSIHSTAMEAMLHHLHLD